jgi:tRNA (cytidine/uridine-2'-O-)-methyltransferase
MRYDPLLHIVLHEPEIPPNAGNVGRTCVAIGAKMWLVRPLGFKLNDYYLRRAGLDYWDELEWEAVDSWDDLVAALAAVGRAPGWFFSARATRSYTDVAYARGDVLVFGSESSGLPRSLQDRHADRLLTIPSRPQVRSLNLSNAAAIGAYEAVRQWGGLSS